MTVGELAEQLNEIYTYAAMHEINIQNFEFQAYPGIRGWETELSVDFESGVVKLV